MPANWIVGLAVGVAVYVGLKLAMGRWVRARGTFLAATLMDAPLAIVLVGAAVFLGSPLPVVLAAVIVGRRFAIILWFWRRASPRRAALGYAALSCVLFLIPLPGLVGAGDYVIVGEWLVGMVVVYVLIYGFVSLALRSLGGEFDAKPVKGDIRRGGS